MNYEKIYRRFYRIRQYSASDRCGAFGQGVKYLNENKFEDITIEAIKRTIVRAEEMGKTNEER